VPADLTGATWPEVLTGGLVLVPVGSTEQHGPHLPLDTDSAVAAAVARRTAELMTQERGDQPVWVSPVVSYGASGEHQAFPGTCSIGTQALRVVIVELVRSICTWAGRVVLVNGHGGNIEALQTAVPQLRAEGRAVAWLPCSASDAGGPADAHAGFTETSLMLHIRRGDVRPELAEAGNVTPIAQLLPDLVRGGVAAVSANGVLGNPGGATAAEGARLLEVIAVAAAGRVLAWQVDDAGRLRPGTGAGQ
jgi:creatinine amidohydrolase